MTEKKNKNWIWFFVVVLFMALLFAGINLMFNLKQQLKPEELAAAEKLWESSGPSDYDLTVHKDAIPEGGQSSIHDVIEVKVRKKRVVDVQFNGKPLPERQWSEYDMSSWLGWVERFMDIDHEPGANRVFCTAQFDPKDGHLIHYIRSVSAIHQRQELEIALRRPE